METQTIETSPLDAVPPEQNASKQFAPVPGTIESNVSRTEQKTEPPPMTFLDVEETRRKVAALRKQLRGHFTPVSTVDGRIHVRENAMIPEHVYELRHDTGIYQFIKRLDGVVEIHEVAPA